MLAHGFLKVLVRRGDDAHRHRTARLAADAGHLAVLEQAQERGAQVYLCGITVAAVDAMPAYLKLGIRTFSAEPAALLPLKKLLMEQEL